MSNKSYFKVTGVIFTIVALVHLWRVINNIPLEFGTTSVPVALSWIGVVLAGILAYQGLRRK